MEKAILSTLSYSDIFAYPLKKDEIWFWLSGPKKDGENFQVFLSNLSRLVREGKISQKGEYFFLNNKEEIVAERILKERASRTKLSQAQRIAGLLRVIPSIKLVAITGSLTMLNAHPYDDIDLLIISSSGQLWTTRFLTLALLAFLGRKRGPGNGEVRDKICPNMFLDEDDLELPPRSLYTAHEILQMQPLWQRGHVYESLLEKNSWVFDFLPNAKPPKARVYDKPRRSPTAFESFLRAIQFWYMSGKITGEKVGPTRAFFHPKDLNSWVLAEHQRRLISL